MSDADDDEGEGDGEDGEGSGGKGKLSGRKLVLFIGVPVIVIILAVVGAFLGGFLDPFLGGDEGEAEVAEHGEGGEGLGPPEVHFLDLPEMLVNLNTGGDRTAFLKIKVSLEIEGAESVLHVEALMPRVVDNFQVYMRELRLEDLGGSAGLFRLKEELLFRVNRAVEPVRVTDILFREMLVQ